MLSDGRSAFITGTTLDAAAAPILRYCAKPGITTDGFDIRAYDPDEHAAKLTFRKGQEYDRSVFLGSTCLELTPYVRITNDEAFDFPFYHRLLSFMAP